VEVVDESKCIEKYQAFVGPSGQGKTASLVKLAGHLVICKKKSIAIATCDTQKVGAVEQLKIYARILNVPFVAIRRPDDWEKLDQALPDVDHVLIDFPGLSLKNEMEIQYLKSMLPVQNPKGCAVHYVQSAIAKNTDAIEVLKKYSVVGPTDIIFTGVDLSNQHGIILNLHKRFQLPLHSFGIGSNIPEDFEMATKERVIDLLFKLTKIQGKRS
jgi:flagellar biosynthesis protein FlhF